MKIKLTPIVTNRLLLRQVVESDWKMISYLRSDKKVNQYVKRKSAETKELALAFLTKIDKGFKTQELFYWVITVKDEEQMIGSICLWNFSENKTKAEVGFDLSPKFQGQGIMDEALKSVIDFTFTNLTFEKIEAYTQQNNENSIKLLARNGFKVVEGKVDEDNLENIVFERNK